MCFAQLRSPRTLQIASASVRNARASVSSSPVRRIRDCASAISVVARWYSHPNATVVSRAARQIAVGDVVAAKERRELAEIGRDRPLTGGAVEGDFLGERFDDREEQRGGVFVLQLDRKHGVADRRGHPEDVGWNIGERGGPPFGEDAPRRLILADGGTDDRVGDPER